MNPVPFGNKYTEVDMRKLIFVLLLLAGALIIMPCLVYGQTAMVLKLSVRRVAVTGISQSKCEDQRVLIVTKDEVMGILTRDDTLQLKRVAVKQLEPRHSIVLCHDELHGNQPYRVRFIQGDDGILLYITPIVVKPATGTLYGLVLSSISCN